MNSISVKILTAFFIIGIGSLFNLSYKGSHNGVSFVDSFTKPQNVEIAPPTDYAKNIMDKIVPSPLPISKDYLISPTCVVYGPISYDNRNTVDMLLNKASITPLFNTIEKPVYDIYWNLGKDKVRAVQLFERQKNGGPLQDEKYKLSLNEDNDWVVSISKITANENVAKELATNLAIKANKINAGGKWQYKNKSVVYFYQTDNAAKIPTEVNAVIEKTFSISKSQCN